MGWHMGEFGGKGKWLPAGPSGDYCGHARKTNSLTEQKYRVGTQTLQQMMSAAVGGFGASFGRDLDRGAKKNPAIFVIIGVLLLAFGWRNFFLGEGKSVGYRIFVTYIGSGLMIIIGGSMTTLGGVYISSIFSDGEQPGPILPIILIGLISLVGIMWGRRDKAARRQLHALELKNMAFLEEIGLEDSGFDSDTLRDAEGNTLKIREQNDARIVFSVVGKRGLRAAITLEGGEMTAYTGIVRA